MSKIDIIGVTETKRNEVDPQQLTGTKLKVVVQKPVSHDKVELLVALFWKTETMGTPLDGFSNGEIDKIL